ncbi:MAG TPA: squalene synthase HpnC [Acidimicrobiales bacterium]|nr:squalene synthase HpnC [Acidimicrobiales bacterium]
MEHFRPDAPDKEQPVVCVTTGSPQNVPAAEHVYVQATRENFPVASWFLPRAVRADLMAVYGFARLTDDIGDESGGDRLAHLEWLDGELGRAVEGRASHPVMRRVGATIDARGLSLQPFRDLIAANRQDQTVRRYETFEDLVGYCRLSANPVGRIVLEIFGAATPDRVSLSDDVCTGLQVVEHLQDVAEDFAADRVYVPLADLAAQGCDVADLAAERAGPALRRVLALEAGRARRLLFSGVPLAERLSLRPRIAVAGFAAGGMAALDAIEAADFDVLAHRCRPRPQRLAARLALVLLAPLGSRGQAHDSTADEPTTHDTADGGPAARVGTRA